MEIRLLKYFLMVAQEGNVTKAAEKLHITQPTLSRQLIQLEEDLGTVLYTRGKRRITLTQAGMLLRRRAEEIVTLTEKTEQEIQDQSNLLSGEIFIGSGEVTAMNELAQLIQIFKEECPQVKYHLYSGNADDIQERIENGFLDIGLLTDSVNVDRYRYESIPLQAREQWGVLMRKDSPLAEKDYVEPTDLLDKPLLITRRAAMQMEFANWFGPDYKNLHILGTYNLIFNAAVMVEEGLGYAFSLEKLVTTKEDGMLLFKPLRPALGFGSMLVWKKDQVQSPATEKFLELVRNAYKA